MILLKITPLLYLFTLVTLSFTCSAQEDSLTFDLYNKLETNSTLPCYDVFEKAMLGYSKLKDDKKIGNNNILTIIDLSLSSNLKRMWVIDIEERIVLYNTLVSHGKNTGQEFASKFSNKTGSYKSSLGFYVTGKNYRGKHGLSLYLDGMEKGFNDNARKRAIVMHGAKYVSRTFSNKYGRIGRSYGCPAIPMESHEEIIKMLENRTCIFIYYPEIKYLNSSKLLNHAI